MGCTPPTGPFIVSSGADKNYSGDITDAFSCIAGLGQNGCGFESQLGSLVASLDASMGGGLNEGFLRDDALLGIVLLTNEDDCTAPIDSDLFDPNMTDPAVDPYGALQSYRCTEFGIKCDSGPLPHLSPATPFALSGCHSAEDGRLTRIAELVTHVKQFKADPNDIFVASIMAPSSDKLTVSPSMVGGIPAPILNHVPGCEGYSADNPIRLASFVSAFGQHGLEASICEGSYQQALSQIGSALGSAGALCVPVAALATAGVPAVPPALPSGCSLVESTKDGSLKEIPACTSSNSGVTSPCYTLKEEASCKASTSTSTPAALAYAFAISRPTAPPPGATLVVACP